MRIVLIGLICLVALVWGAVAQDVTTLRECITADGYTSAVFGVAEMKYETFSQSRFADLDVVALLDTPAVAVNAQTDAVLGAGRGLSGSDNWAWLVYRGQAGDATWVIDPDPDVAFVQKWEYGNFGENPRLIVTAADLDGDAVEEMYVFVYAHPFAPGAVTRDGKSFYGWHGRGCTLRFDL